MPSTGFTIEETGVVYRSQGKPETELRFRKPIQEIQEEPPTTSTASEKVISILPPAPPSPLIESVIESSAPPVLEIAEEPQWTPSKPSRIEKVMLKAAVEVISHHQAPVPYRELLNQVYMDLVDKKVDFDSARQIETTLLNHNGREILLVEEADEANDRIVKKWWLGEQKLAPEKKGRIPLVGRITHSKPKLPTVHFPFRRSRKSRYVEKATDDNSADP